MTQDIQKLNEEIEKLKKEISQLEKSEDKYHKMFTTANDAIFILRGDKFTDCNEKTLEMFRCKRDEIIGHPPYEFSPENQPGGNDSYSEAMKKLTQHWKVSLNFLNGFISEGTTLFSLQR